MGSQEKEGGEEMNILETLMGFLGEALGAINKFVASEGEADEQVNKACAAVIIYRQELEAFAKRTDTPYDDMIVQEIIGFAHTQLSPELVAQIELLYGAEEIEPA